MNQNEWWFALTTLFNTSIGLSNMQKNSEQELRQNRIEEKIDKILEILNNGK